MATIASAAAGNWSVGATWVGGIRPATTDIVNISHAITLDVNETTETILYGRITILAGGTLTFPAGTCIAIKAYLYVNGGKLDMQPGSKVLFKTTSSSVTGEGVGLSGILVENTANSIVLIRGSAPYPETLATAPIAIGDSVIPVADASTFGVGDLISLFIDGKDAASWSWGNPVADEGFTIHHIVGNNIYIQQRVAVKDTLYTPGVSGTNYVYVSNGKIWQPNQKVFVGNDLYTIQSTDPITRKVTFTGNLSTNYVTMPYLNMLDFNGTNTYVEFNTAMRVPNSFTVQFWVYINNAALQQTMLCRAGAAGENLLLLDTVVTTGIIQIVLNNATRTTTTAVTAGVQNYALSFLESGSSTVAKLYKDGALVHTFSFDASKINDSPALKAWCLGQDWDSAVATSGFLSGEMWDVSFWSKELTLAEINTNMTRKLTGTESDLIAYYPIDEASGTVVYDKCINAYNGTVVGTNSRALQTQVSMIETGASKAHITGKTVSKLCTVTTADVASGTAVIPVASNAGLSANDRVIIEGNGIGPTYALEYTILSNAPTSITLSTNLGYNVLKGAMVVKSNRNTVISTTNPADNLNRFFFYDASGSASGKRISVLNAEFNHMGNSYSWPYYGFCIRGQYDNTNEECDVRGCSFIDSLNYDYTGVVMGEQGYRSFRNNVVHKLRRLRSYANNGQSMMNNIAIGMISATYTIEYETSYYRCAYQYNIISNCSHGLVFGYCSDTTYPVWHHIIKNSDYPIVIGSTNIAGQTAYFLKNSFINVLRVHWPSYQLRMVIEDIEVTPNSALVPSTPWQSDYAANDIYNNVIGSINILHLNFERGNFRIIQYTALIEKDETIHCGNGWSYRFFFLTNGAYVDRNCRLSQMIHVKSNVEVSVVAYMRKGSTYNGTKRPRIVAKGYYLPYTYLEMANEINTWVRVELKFTPTHDEMVEIGVGGEGSVGYCWIDPRVTITCYDVDIIRGPYSVNLSVGLHEPYSNPAALSIGGGILL